MKFDKHDLVLAEGLVKTAAREELMTRFHKVSSTVKADGSLIAMEAGAAGGLMDGYTDDFSQALTLEPCIGMAATDGALLELWRGWIADEIKKV